MKIEDSFEAGCEIGKAEKMIKELADDLDDMSGQEKGKALWNDCYEIYRRLEDYRIPE